MLIPPNKKVGGIIFGIFAFINGIGDFAYCVMLDIKILPKIIILYTTTLVWVTIASVGFKMSENNFDS